MKVSVIYNSNTGVTQELGKAIGDYLTEKGVDSRLMSIDEVNETVIKESDHVFLGTPVRFLGTDKKWEEFVNKMPKLRTANVHLFTTYKYVRGGFFRKMKDSLQEKVDSVKLLFRSRDGQLSATDKRLLEIFIVS